MRLLPINEDNIKLIYIMIEGMDNKHVEFKLPDKKFDKHFAS